MHDDYRYSQEAHNANLRIHWKCTSCGDEYEAEPGCNEGGGCSCGGNYQENGESYDS
jgi:hypothetical protein